MKNQYLFKGKCFAIFRNGNKEIITNKMSAVTYGDDENSALRNLSFQVQQAANIKSAKVRLSGNLSLVV